MMFSMSCTGWIARHQQRLYCLHCCAVVAFFSLLALCPASGGSCHDLNSHVGWFKFGGSVQNNALGCVSNAPQTLISWTLSLNKIGPGDGLALTPDSFQRGVYAIKKDYFTFFQGRSQFSSPSEGDAVPESTSSSLDQTSCGTGPKGGLAPQLIVQNQYPTSQLYCFRQELTKSWFRQELTNTWALSNYSVQSKMIQPSLTTYVPKMKFSIGANQSIATPLLDNGNLYANTGVTLISTNWAAPTQFDRSCLPLPNNTKVTISSPAIDPTNGQIYAGSLCDTLYAVRNTSGSIVWTFGAPDMGRIQSSPALDTAGNIYFAGSTSLYAVSPQGNKLWTQPHYGDTDFSASPVLYENGISAILLINSKTVLRCYNLKDGSLAWTKNFDLGVTTPCIRGDGVVFVAGVTMLYVLSPQGSILLTISSRVKGSVFNLASPVVSTDGILYFSYSIPVGSASGTIGSNLIAYLVSIQTSGSLPGCDLGSVFVTPNIVEVPARCQACATNTYQEGNVCVNCPSGMASLPGSSGLDSCVNIVPNYIVGYCCALLSSVLALIYICQGRFHKVAFLRRERIVKPLTKSYNHSLRIMDALLQVLARHDEEEHSSHAQARPIAAFLFVLLSVLVMIVCPLVVFLAFIVDVLFKVLVVSHGYRIYTTVPFEAVAANLILELEKNFQFIPFSLLLYPFIALFGALASFRVNFSAIQVTCRGALAPIALNINLLVLGFLTLVIQSDYQLFYSLVFSRLLSAHTKIVTSSRFGGHLHKVGVVRGAGTHFRQLISSLLWVAAVSAFVNLSGILKVAMGLVNVSAFWNDGKLVSQYSEKQCGSTDKLLAIFASVLCWLMLQPVLYEVSKILVPGPPISELRAEKEGDYEGEFASSSAIVRSFHGFVHSCVSFYAPDMVMAQLSNSALTVLGFAVPVIPKENKGKEEVVSKLAVTSLLRPPSDEENEKWVDELVDRLLPSYTFLLQLESKELLQNDNILENEITRQLPCLILMNAVARSAMQFGILIGYGHLATSIGRKIWGRSLWKYVIFLQVAFGCWTEQASELYRLGDYISTSGKLTKMGSLAAPRKASTRAAQAQEFEIHKIRVQHLYSQCIAAMVGIRCILMQAVPLLTAIMVFTYGTAGFPLFCCKSIDERLPPIVIRDVWARAALQQILDGYEVQRWVSSVSAPTIFIMESRLCLYVINASVMLFCIAVPFVPVSFLSALVMALIVVLLPYSFVICLPLVVIIGRNMKIRDVDLNLKPQPESTVRGEVMVERCRKDDIPVPVRMAAEEEAQSHLEDPNPVDDRRRRSRAFGATRKPGDRTSSALGAHLSRVDAGVEISTVCGAIATAVKGHGTDGTQGLFLTQDTMLQLQAVADDSATGKQLSGERGKAAPSDARMQRPSLVAPDLQTVHNALWHSRNLGQRDVSARPHSRQSPQQQQQQPQQQLRPPAPMPPLSLSLPASRLPPIPIPSFPLPHPCIQLPQTPRTPLQRPSQSPASGAAKTTI